MPSVQSTNSNVEDSMHNELWVKLTKQQKLGKPPAWSNVFPDPKGGGGVPQVWVISLTEIWLQTNQWPVYT